MTAVTVLEDFRTRYGLNGTGQSPLVTPHAGRHHLCELWAALEYRRGAEIGVWEGGFAEKICRTNPGVHLTCVDPWQAYQGYLEPKNDQRRLDVAYERTRNLLQPFDCEILRMTSLKAAARVPDGSLDFVYIDANHRAVYVWDDLIAWSTKVRAGGIIAGHDYTKRKAHIEVKDIVDRFTQAHAIHPWFVLAADKSPTFFWVQA